jgi:hypothetical protein
MRRHHRLLRSKAELDSEVPFVGILESERIAPPTRVTSGSFRESPSIRRNRPRADKFAPRKCMHCMQWIAKNCDLTHKNRIKHALICAHFALKIH